MRTIAALGALAAALAVAVPPATAAETGSPSDPGPALPPICGAANDEGPAMDSMNMAEAEPVDEAHKALMAGMPAMNAGMNQGMKASNIDVAFVCSMIPHHQGAIDMARAELLYGKDPANRERAQKIISAQEMEIREMLAWLKAQTK